MRKLYFLVLGLFVFSGVTAQIVTIPDANFKAVLLGLNGYSNSAIDIGGKAINIDSNNNGEIEVSEALFVYSLNVNSLNILDLTGIQSFSNLKSLNCTYNQITSLDISGLTNLSELYCFENQLQTINLSGLTNLSTFKCYKNKISNLNLTGLTKLRLLNCFENNISVLNLNGLSNLEILDCYENQISTIDFSSSPKLNQVLAGKNPIESIDLSQLPNLKSLWLGFTPIYFLDLSKSTKLSGFNFSSCPNIESVNLKNGSIDDINYFEPELFEYLNIDCSNFSSCPKLQYICGDDSELAAISQKIAGYNYTNCVVGSYCSFVPGGAFYTIQGTDKYDSNNNGCDVSDLPLFNLKFSVTDGTTTGSVIANTTGNYVIPVQAGTHTITPALESPSYFAVSPTNTVVTFPTQASPFTQDFCVTANGVHPDLEVTALPTTRARAGFDASYKIIYKNKGTQTQSGSVNLTFNDAVLDLVSASPVATAQNTNNLSWSFTNLKPFETREITVTVNVNGPMETPAVNGGDILDFTATITSTLTDETPTDNTFTLNQTVVNAFDPNDKTCLEGATIPPSAVGKYVHYMIRFENKGTAEAQNVVVKDMIDTDKFDISSLIVTQGSHPFVTRITETNKVEFIFENINLPFDDATNDGYVAFKIKTKPSLVVGDSFSNTASIYFDYNFPIITNTATTSVLQNLGTQDFEFSTYFNVYPNPAKQVLNIDVKKEIALSSISIFNTLGQQILVIPNAQKTRQVDVSSLKTGSYFIKVISDKGSASGKFVKE